MEVEDSIEKVDDSMNIQIETSIGRVEYSKNVEDSIEKVTRLK